MIFIDDNNLNKISNAYTPFINTLKDSYSEKEQKVWMINKYEKF